MNKSELIKIVERIKVEEGYDKLDPIAERIGVKIRRLYDFKSGRIDKWIDIEQGLKIHFNKYYFKNYDDLFTNHYEKDTIPINRETTNKVVSNISQSENNSLPSTDDLIREIHEIVTSMDFVKEATSDIVNVFNRNIKKGKSDQNQKTTN